MTMTRAVAAASLSLILLVVVTYVDPSLALNEHEILFPPNDEYDHRILDPNSVYGSPYGGFARAARSRLAQLPLILPGEEEEFGDTEYMTVTDGDGRRYACRTHSEDDVTRRSLSDSFLDHVAIKPLPNLEDDLPVEDPTPLPVSTLFPTEQRTQASKFEILSVIKKLEGVCTQIHKGWWSYEWCFDEQVRQFHVQLTANPASKSATTVSEIKMESITSLGNFQSRSIETMAQVEEKSTKRHAEKLLSSASSVIKKTIVAQETLDRTMKQLLGEELPLGVVVDTHVGGEICESTKKPRTTQVEYRCCSPQSVAQLKPFVLFKGNLIPSDIASIVKLEEPTVCNYHIIICTPLLCNGLAEEYEDGPQTAFSSKMGAAKTWYGNSNQIPSAAAKEKKSALHPTIKKPRKENESIRDTIERTMDGVCLLSNTNEWWAYEFCHGHHVRQYHEGKIFDPKSGVTSLHMEAQYWLGKYDADRLESFERDEEIMYVVNVTELDKAVATAAKLQARSLRGSGAYFYQEYMDGQECDGTDPDVGTKGGVPRATTVRYFCGPTFALSNVREDATCHYIIDVTIPDLCEHPLFRKPLDKKQMIKCLPLID